MKKFLTLVLIVMGTITAVLPMNVDTVLGAIVFAIGAFATIAVVVGLYSELERSLSDGAWNALIYASVVGISVLLLVLGYRAPVTIAVAITSIMYTLFALIYPAFEYLVQGNDKQTD